MRIMSIVGVGLLCDEIVSRSSTPARCEVHLPSEVGPEIDDELHGQFVGTGNTRHDTTGSL